MARNVNQSGRSRWPRSVWLACSLSVLTGILVVGYLWLKITVTIAATVPQTPLPLQVADVVKQPIVEFSVTILSRIALLASSILGVLIVVRHPRNPVGWILCMIALMGAVEAFSGAYGIYAIYVAPDSFDSGMAAAWLTEWSWAVSTGLLGPFLLLYFPNGRLNSPRWRPLAWLAAVATVLLTVGMATKPGPFANYAEFSGLNNPLGLEGIVGDVMIAFEMVGFGALLVSLLIAAVLLPLRLRRASGYERQQLKLVVFIAVILAILFIIQALVRHILNIATPFFDRAYDLAWAITFTSLPIATGLAILRYRLYDIDILINRMLVYGALTVTVVGCYVLVVGTLGILFQAHSSLAVSLIATGLVAVGFQPLRDRLQRNVNRLIYGERDDPYVVLSRLSQRLEATLAPNAILPTIVQTVREALKLPYAAITLATDSQSPTVQASTPEGQSFKIVAASGVSLDDSIILPLAHQGATIGQLILSRRSPAEPFNASDLRLLGDLARQTSIAVHAMRLTLELRRSHEQLVLAREEERRRLRRDLHDGLGPALAAQALKVSSARALLENDRPTAATLLAELEHDIQAALTDIRRLVYNLRPPALDDLGLVGALRLSAAQYRVPSPSRDESGELDRLQISVEVLERLPDLPAAVEVAAYRIVQEALANVVRHAHARTCRVRLSVNDALFVEVSDDGAGLPVACQQGVGLASMRERAEELGGTCAIESAPDRGTCIRARLPLPPVALSQNDAMAQVA